MSGCKVGIISVGKYLPKKVLTNFDLEKMVDTSDEWITTRTGIKERRISEGESASELAFKASLQALERAGISPQDLELIIVATITPDTSFPSTACHLQKHLKAEKAACFDISAACAGYVYALVVAQSLIGMGLYKNALVVGSEVLSTITDWQDRSTCVLFGDGAGACILAPVKKGGIISSYLGSDGSLGDLLILPAGGSKLPASFETIKKRLHYIKMEGRELFKQAVKIMVDAALIALKRANLNSKDVRWLIPHQANLRIINAVAQRLEIPPEKVYVNIHKYGNMSSASTAVALCEVWEEGKVKEGDIIVLDAFGGGLVWGACVIEWI